MSRLISFMTSPIRFSLVIMFLLTAIFLTISSVHPIESSFFPFATAAEPSEVPQGGDLDNRSCELGSPTNGLWDQVNRWDPQVLEAIELVEAEEGIRVPGNRIKAHMMIESQGNPDAFQDNPLGDAYGLMQITENAYVADRLDFSRLMEPAYNLYAGALELAVRYQNASCNKGWDGASYGYFGGDPCGMGLCDPVNGTCPDEYHTMLQNYMKELEDSSCGPTDSGRKNPPRDPNNGKSACVITKVGEPSASPTLPPGCGIPGAPCQKPPEPYPSDLLKEIYDTWGIEIKGGMSEEQLRWVYEVFYSISGTPFLSFIKGTQIQSYSSNGNISVQIGCPGPHDGDVDVQFANGLGESATKAIMIHELTHVFQFCVENGKTNLSEIPGIREQEGSLTQYSATGCGIGGIDLNNEDHAETISYHLNPDLPPQTCGNDLDINPYDTGKFPLHKALAIDAVGDFSCSQ